MIPWHPHTQPPAEHGVTAIIGIRTGNQVDPARRWMLVPGVYAWDADTQWWRSEQGEHHLTFSQYWYCLESDLLAHLSARAHLAENGHG